MDLNFSPEDVAFRERVRKWFKENTPKEEFKSLAECKAWCRKLYERIEIKEGRK